MDSLINALASFIQSVGNLLPSWSFTHDVSADIAVLSPYWQKANVLFPMQTVFDLMTIWIGLQLLLLALYWVDRIVNLIRGAG